MIRVNLLRDAVAAAQKSENAGTQFNVKLPSFGGSGGADNGPMVTRGILFILPIILIYSYSWYSSYELDNKLQNMKKESAAMDTQVDAMKPQLDTIEKLNTEKNKITTQVNAIKDLSKKRFNYVKILDALQTLIPEKAWLTKMVIKERAVSIEGRANDDSTISSFMQNLEESAYFQNVTWESSKEVTEPQGVVKMFSIQFNLENLP